MISLREGGCGLISQDVFINEFWKVKSPTKPSTQYFPLPIPLQRAGEETGEDQSARGRRLRCTPLARQGLVLPPLLVRHDGSLREFID